MRSESNEPKIDKAREKIISEKSGRSNVKTGDRVSIQFDASDVLYFNAESGQRLYGM